jgi:hypothetical protein
LQGALQLYDVSRRKPQPSQTCPDRKSCGSNPNAAFFETADTMDALNTGLPRNMLNFSDLLKKSTVLTFDLTTTNTVPIIASLQLLRGKEMQDATAA